MPERGPIPGRRVLLRLFDASELLVGIVDDVQLRLLARGEAMAKYRANTLANNAGAVVDDVVELLEVTMDVRDEMLRRLGQVEDCLEVDDLGENGLTGRELLRRASGT